MLNRFYITFTKINTMKNLYVTTALLLLVLVLAGTQLNAQGDAMKLKSEITEMNNKMLKAWKAEDWATANSYYAENVISMPSYEPMLKGKSTVVEKSKKDHEAGYKMLEMNLNIDEVFPDKMYVIEVGHYVVKMSVPNMKEPINDNGKYVTVWERQKDGTLKVFIETWNSDINPMEMQGKKMDKEK
jgi:ketosteroid isomerase-like protein